MSENTNNEVTSTPEVTPTTAMEVDNTPGAEISTEARTIAQVQEEIAGKVAETAPAVDYSQYAGMANTPTVSNRRTFDTLSVSGKVETEVMEDGETEKRKPATAYKSLLTKPKTTDDKFQSEILPLPLTIVPIKYRVVMQQTTGNQGEILVLKSSEFNGKMSDMVVITRFSPDGKVVEKYGPMTVADARKKFTNAEGKGVLRDKAHVYALHNGEVVRFVVKGAGLWEDRAGLVNGKTENSRKPYPYLSEYLATFPMTEPYFLFEMKVDAAYRDHGTVKFYRPIFEKGARISPEVEVEVLKHLEDLHKYFAEQDKATAEFVASATAPATVVTEGEEMELDENGNPVF